MRYAVGHPAVQTGTQCNIMSIAVFFVLVNDSRYGLTESGIHAFDILL